MIFHLCLRTIGCKFSCGLYTKVFLENMRRRIHSISLPRGYLILLLGCWLSAGPKLNKTYIMHGSHYTVFLKVSLSSHAHIDQVAMATNQSKKTLTKHFTSPIISIDLNLLVTNASLTELLQIMRLFGYSREVTGSTLRTR